MLISFEIDCFYGLWTRIYEYELSSDLSSFRRPNLVPRAFSGGEEKALGLANIDTFNFWVWMNLRHVKYAKYFKQYGRQTGMFKKVKCISATSGCS